MAYGEIEDGMGFSGLAPSPFERAEDRRVVGEWNRAIEAAAKAVETYGLARVNEAKDYPATTAAACVHRIRTLKR
jgi:hypothetical protein